MKGCCDRMIAELRHAAARMLKARQDITLTTPYTPGESVLVSADSQPPVPVPVKMKGVPAFVWNTYLTQQPQDNISTPACEQLKCAARKCVIAATPRQGGVALATKHSLAVVQQLLEEGSKEGVSVVLSWHVHRTQHAFMDVDGTCCGEEQAVLVRCEGGTGGQVGVGLSAVCWFADHN